MAEQPARLHLRLHPGGLLLHRARRTRRTVEPTGRGPFRGHCRGGQGQGPRRGLHARRPARARTSTGPGDPRRQGVDRPRPLPDSRRGTAPRHRRDVRHAERDPVRGTGRAVHRRRCARPAPDRDRPRRLPGDIRPIPLRLSPLRHRPHRQAGQPALRHRLRRLRRRPPRPDRPRLPQPARGRPDDRRPPGRPGDRGVRHRLRDRRRRARRPGPAPLVHQPLPGAQRLRPPDRRRRPRHRCDPPPQRGQGSRQRPPQPRPPQRGRRSHRQLPRPGGHRPRAARRRRPGLLRPGLRRPLPGPADR